MSKIRESTRDGYKDADGSATQVAQFLAQPPGGESRERLSAERRVVGAML